MLVRIRLEVSLYWPLSTMWDMINFFWLSAVRVHSIDPLTVYWFIHAIGTAGVSPGRLNLVSSHHGNEVNHNVRWLNMNDTTRWPPAVWNMSQWFISELSLMLKLTIIVIVLSPYSQLYSLLIYLCESGHRVWQGITATWWEIVSGMYNTFIASGWMDSRCVLICR